MERKRTSSCMGRNLRKNQVSYIPLYFDGYWCWLQWVRLTLECHCNWAGGSDTILKVEDL